MGRKGELISQGTYARVNLEHFRDDFSSEEPPRVVHSHQWDPQTQTLKEEPLSGTTQWQRMWWAGLIGILCNSLEDGEIPARHRRRVERFVDHYTSREFHFQELTTQGDINGAAVLFNNLLGRKRTPIPNQ